MVSWEATMTKLGRTWLAVLVSCAMLACGDDGPPGGVDGGGAPGDGGSAAMDGGGGEGDAGSPPTDAGGAAADAGEPAWPDDGSMLPAPAWAALTVGPLDSCPALTACGGDVVDAWDVSGGCFEVDIESTIASCPGAMVTRREGRGRGRVVFGADGFAHRVAQAEVEVDVFIPAICAAVVSCPMIEAAMRPYVSEASCTANAMGACECTATNRTAIDDRDAYRVEGNEIVSVSSGKRWAYCIDGDRLSYRDTSAAEPREPGIVELTRR
jgi:hypothetical protein